MPIETLKLDDAQVETLLSLRESHFVDMKSRLISPAKLTKALSAFANADGGELYVGVSETDGIFEWAGFNDPEDANGHLQIFEQLFPLGDGFQYTFFESPKRSGFVLHILVLRSAQIKKASDGIVYLRRSAASQPITTDSALRQLERDKGLSSFENETVQISIDAISNSETVLEFIIDAFPTSEPERWLRTQRVIVDDKPTVAGVLLYDDLPQSALPKRSSVKLYRYKTSDSEGTREALVGMPTTIEGSLVRQIRESVRQTAELVESLKVLGDSGLTSVSYPIEALHEIITNALIHRDYGITDDVHIRVFDNRIEVESPGRLAGHVSPQNILSERFARNGTIVRLVNKFPDAPNKDVGEGLNTAFEAMKQLQLKDPIISELDHSVLVNIRHERLASPEQMIMEYLESNPEINNSMVRSLTGIGSENKVKVIFQSLMKRRQIERVPDKNGPLAAYQLPR